MTIKQYNNQPKLKMYRMANTGKYGYCVMPYTFHDVVKVEDLRAWLEKKNVEYWNATAELLALLELPSPEAKLTEEKKK